MPFERDETAAPYTARSQDISEAIRAFRSFSGVLAFGSLFLLFIVIFIPVNYANTLSLIYQMEYSDQPLTEAEILAMKFSSVAQLGVVALMGLAGFFAYATMRPRWALAFLGVLAANWAWGYTSILTADYSRFGMNLLPQTIWSIMAAIVLLAISGIFVLRSTLPAFALTPDLQRAARPAPPMPNPVTLFRTMLGVWPGLKRSGLVALLSGFLAYLSSLLANFTALLRIIPPLLPFPAFVIGVLQANNGPLPPMFGQGMLFMVIVVLLLLVVSLFFQFLAQLLRRGAQGLSRQSFASLVSRDRRPPILFLRSFADDQVTMDHAGYWSRLLRAEPKKRRLDHMLVEQFAAYGPVVAIGRPGEKRLPFGAARTYVADAVWQETVLKLATDAAHIVIVADPSAGVAWEIDSMLDERFRGKTLFLASPRNGDLVRNAVIKEWAQANLSTGGLPSRALAMYAPRANEALVLTSKIHDADAYQVAMQSFFRRVAAKAAGTRMETASVGSDALLWPTPKEAAP